jgi:Calcium binding
VRRSGTRANRKWSRRWPPIRTHLERLVEEAIVDAYNESEQRCGLFTMIDDHLTLPFDTDVLGVAVTVERIDLTEADEVVAICRRGRTRQRIAVLNLPLPSPPPDGAEWIEAYRYWARGR